MTPTERREQALGILYAADAMGVDPDTDGADSRTTRLVDRVWEHRRELDRVIGDLSHDWRVERMPPVDRNVLRLGAYELLHTETPVGVVISEAVELAKRFSTSSSGKFVNGILGAIAEERTKY